MKKISKHAENFKKQNSAKETPKEQITKNEGATEKFRRGGVAKSKVPGNKHVDVVKGYRLVHGYKAVKGADKDTNYSKGVPKVKVDKGWRLPHGYETTEGAYNMKYKNGGDITTYYNDLHSELVTLGMSKKTAYNLLDKAQDEGYEMFAEQISAKDGAKKLYDKRRIILARPEGYATGSNIDSEWFGVDASLNISLEEYGFVATQRADKDYDDEYFVVYKISNDAYGKSYIRESELNAIIEGKEWADEDDIKSFLDFCGVSKEEWLDSRFEHKLSDLLGYWGHQNIMGIDYYHWDKSHAYSLIGLDEEYRRGGIAKSKVPGNKHVDVAKGYRLTHGYKAVKGSDKNYNYAKGVAKLKVDKGWRLPHGYEVEEGAYNMKYKEGGEFDDKKYQDRYLLKNYGYKGKKGDKIIVSGYDDVLEVVYGSPLGITEKYEYLIKDTSTLPVLKEEGAYDMKYAKGSNVKTDWLNFKKEFARSSDEEALQMLKNEYGDYISGEDFSGDYGNSLLGKKVHERFIKLEEKGLIEQFGDWDEFTFVIKKISLEEIYNALKNSPNFQKVELRDSKDSSTGKEIYILSKLVAPPEDDLNEGNIDEFVIWYDDRTLTITYLPNGYDREVETIDEIIDYTRANEQYRTMKYAKGSNVVGKVLLSSPYLDDVRNFSDENDIEFVDWIDADRGYELGRMKDGTFVETKKDRKGNYTITTTDKAKYRTGGVAGSKHVDVTKGYRLVHGYRAVKGSDKQYNYSKGYPKVKVTPGYRLPHGYEIAEGAYNKKYDTGGNFDLTPEQYHRAVNHFIYFCFNYPNNFMDAFSNMKDHLQSKFHSIYDRVGSKAAMITFYTELDSENQKALLYWVMNNYKGTKLAEGGMLDVDVLSSFDIMKKGSNVNAKSSYVMLKGNRAYCGVHDKTYSEAVETAKSHACNSDMIIKGEMIWTNGRVKGIRLDDGTEMIYEQYEREFFTEPQLNQLKKISKRK